MRQGRGYSATKRCVALDDSEAYAGQTPAGLQAGQKFAQQHHLNNGETMTNNHQ